MPAWEFLFDILVLLGAALVLGTLAERFGQSALLGYLLAGTLAGPNVLGFVEEKEHVKMIAELGVALLLFTIGLEFSFRRLRRLGRVALLGGSLQVVVTLLVGAGVAAASGLDLRAAIAVGAMIALSSTACVLRLLADRSAIDSLHGRNAVGILLFQDLALIPLVLLLTMLAGDQGASGTAVMLGKTVLVGAVLVGSFIFVFNVVVPRVLNIRQLSRNRELPILLAVVLALGSAYAARSAGLTPAIGAFIAGLILGETPFATQIRADIASLRTLLVTLFFASIGLVGDPKWAFENWPIVGAVIVAIVVGKTFIVTVIVRSLGYSLGIALGTGLCIAQVGEFSFVLAQVAHGELINDRVFKLMTSVTIGTLFLTPFLVGAVPHAAGFIEAIRRRTGQTPEPVRQAEQIKAEPGRVIIIGFGPAGQSVAEALYAHHKDQLTVLELNPRTAAAAQRLGLRVHLGDAAQRDVLEEAGVKQARAIAITIPDPDAARTIVELCRDLAPQAPIAVRSRYHMRRWELELAGAREVIDEEETVGLRVAASVRKFLHAQEPDRGHESEAED